MENKRKDKMYFFFEEYFIRIFISVFITFLLFLKSLTYTDYVYEYDFLNKIDSFIVNELSMAFIDRDSTLITIAAVFIGIYFTVFTLLATLSGKTSFLILTRRHFKSLIVYTRNAFIAAFAYLVISLISPLLINLSWIYSITCLILLVYMLMSALRFGFLIYLILRSDMDNLIDKSERKNVEEKRLEVLFSELERYLEKQFSEEGKVKAEEISQLLKKRREK